MENFIERIFTLRRLADATRSENPVRAIVDFQTRNKLLIMAHSPKQQRELGRLVADPKSLPPARLLDRYRELLMAALKLLATPKKNTNVLMHMLGHFKKVLGPDEKRELLDILEAYRLERIPLIVPVTLIGHYVRKFDQPYLKEQTYLNPHPLELQLRNHV